MISRKFVPASELIESLDGLANDENFRVQQAKPRLEVEKRGTSGAGMAPRFDELYRNAGGYEYI